MKRWGKWGAFALAVAVGAGLASRVVISQQPAPQPLPLVEVASANHLFEPVRPHLEAVLGRRLETVARFQLATTAQLARLADADLDAYLRWHFPLLRGDTLTATRHVARQIVASAAMAQYVEGTDVILVVPEAQPRIASWNETLVPINTPTMLQLALVHETMRFLLDRHHHLGDLRAACRDGEEYQALLSVIEGLAQSVTRQVAARLGQEETFPLLARRYLCVPDQAPDPGLRTVSQTALRDRNRACVQGENFFTVVEAALLSDVEACVFGRLPRQGRSIVRPDLWLRALKENRPELTHALQSVENLLPAAEWQAQQQSWTPAMLAQAAAMLGVARERADRLETTWDEGRSLLWSHRQQAGQQVALSVVRHETAAAARTYFGFAVDLQRKQDSQTPASCGAALQVVESQSTGVMLAGFDEAVRNDKKIRYGAGNEPMPVHLLLARAGDLVIECTWYGNAADAALAERITQAVRHAVQ